MHIHILGICGTFMGGVAALAREAGHTVTGCDAGVYPPMSDQLRALGIDLIEGFGADQTALKPDMYVIGNVVSRARLDATQTGHEVGDRTLLDLLNAQNDDAATALALAQARSALLIDHLRLALLAGQLDEARLRAVNQALAPAQ